MGAGVQHQCVQVRHNTERINCIRLFPTALCDDLIVLANGVISYSPATTPRLEGAMATHSCTEGYGLSGGMERTCQSDRTWSGVIITCQQCKLVCSSFHHHPHPHSTSCLRLRGNHQLCCYELTGCHRHHRRG